VLALTGALAARASSEGSKLTPQELAFFEKNIRPVLSERCYKCHSTQPDAKVRAGLDLGTREGILKGGDSGPAIVAGKPADSLLIRSLKAADPDEVMPPAKDGGPLPPEVIAAFEHWVKMGAPDPRSEKSSAKYGPDAEKARSHPFFNPVKPVPVPAVTRQDWVKTPVDAFVLAKLEANAMQPSPPADKRTLIRRATFDLLGLPPTPEEVDAFLADKSPDAFNKVVERLLQSPHYGERWGRYWLDVARYGDTKGDVIRNRENRFLYSYTYRDYVIRAFNEDKPYDRFLIEQIAADRLPLGEDKSALAALGFLTLGNKFNNDANQIIDDQIDVITRGTMGLTVACARCHDHKFDPITMKDYYALHGVLNSSAEPPEPPLLKPVQRDAAFAEFEKAKAAAEAELARFRAENERSLITNQHARVGDYLLAVHEFAQLTGPDTPTRTVFYRQRELDTTIAGAVERWVERAKKKPDPVLAPWLAFAALPAKEFSEQARSVAHKLAANRDESAPANPLVARLFVVPPTSLKDVAGRYNRLLGETSRQWQALLTKGGVTRAFPDKTLEEVRLALYASGSPFAFTERDIRRLTSQQTEARENLLIRKVNDVIINHPGSPARAMALEDLPKPRDSAIFLRGNPATRGAVVPRQFLEILAGPSPRPFTNGSGRLELAQAIASRDNPLTARVLVNRVWLRHFGEGLVTTPSDFGLVGEPPTHPELLDWLAGWFMDHGWSLKQLHRLIMNSATYQQRSDDNPRYSAKDQGNSLLWRQNRYRLDFEAMRDTMLAVSGALDRTMGGQPVNLATDPSPPRRTVYGFIDRAALPEFFNTFDFAPPDISSPRRIPTTVPQQALYLLNAPFVVQQAKHLAARPEWQKLTSTVARIKALYRLLFQRPPSATELRLGTAFLQAQMARKPEAAEPPAWRYGFGSFDAQAQRTAKFTAFTTFEQNQWHGGRRLGTLALTAEGGTTGTGSDQAAIRRWVAPRNGVIAVQGTLSVKSGGAVVGRVVSSRLGERGRFTAAAQPASTAVERLEVKKGDLLDFIAESSNPKAGVSYLWAPKVTYLDHNFEDPAVEENYEWDAKVDFAGPPPPPLKGLSPWEKYAQVLLLSNELIFVH
jgi:hypothetical protein